MLEHRQLTVFEKDFAYFQDAFLSMVKVYVKEVLSPYSKMARNE